jgi:hypothetical protein
MLVILMLLIKFIAISLCCKFYVEMNMWNSYIVTSNGCDCDVAYICSNYRMNMNCVHDELSII